MDLLLLIQTNISFVMKIVNYFQAGIVKKEFLVMNITILQMGQEELNLYAAMDLL